MFGSGDPFWVEGWLSAMATRFQVEGLDVEWDQVETIRERLKAGKTLSVLPSGATVKADATIVECTANADLLVPCLHRLLPAQLKVPDIGPLRDVIESVYKKNQREVTMDVIDDDSWEVRKLVRFVKRKAQRSDPSTET